MRLLVIGNSCLSNEESNGRVTRTLLSAFSSEDLSCLALRGIPDIEGVDYCTVTDGDAAKAFLTLGLRKPKGIQTTNTQSQPSDARSNRKARDHVLRDIVWFSPFWKLGKVSKWLKGLNVGAVFLMAADAPFLYRLARKVAKRKKIPLVIYSSEDYFLKRYNYVERKVTMNLWCRLFLNKLRKEAKKAFQQASLSMLCSKKLLRSVKGAFGDIPAEVVYQPSTLKPFPKRDGPITRIVYGGNVNADRLHALLDVANCIHAFEDSLVLDVYGDASEEVKAAMEAAPSVAYHGKVPYRELLKAFETTDLLVHVEDFSEYRQLDCAHGFSTKIGDCYRSGIPFFLYGPASIPCIQFGLDLCPEYTAASPEELKAKLEAILAGKVPYMSDENVIRECFDADVVGKKIAELIETCRSR